MGLEGRVTALEQSLARVIRGKAEAVRLSVVCLLARGHLLIEDVPGVGKTTLAHTLAHSLDSGFHRIQFTSDMLPSDVVGVTVYNSPREEFEFKPGPIFTNFLLADEINRTTPKTQSALLEAMNERQVTIEGTSYRLPEPFMVIATQNPVEYHGTYPLPESQLDRFLMRIEMGYPDPASEREILRSSPAAQLQAEADPVASGADVIGLQREVEDVKVDDSVVDYLMTIVAKNAQPRTPGAGREPSRLDGPVSGGTGARACRGARLRNASPRETAGRAGVCPSHGARRPLRKRRGADPPQYAGARGDPSHHHRADLVDACPLR